MTFSLSLLVLCLLPLAVFCGSLKEYNVDTSRITVSGLSSGASMASQFHVAHSSEIVGVGAIAGTAYWCANNNLYVALACVDGFGVVSELWAATDYAASLLSIDDPSNISNARVWLFHGQNDEIVSLEAMKKMEQYYLHYIELNHVKTSFNVIPSAHGWPAVATGVQCDIMQTPFVNNCTFDASGDLLQFILGPLDPPTKFNESNLFTFSQGDYTPLGVDPALISMDDTGYIYVPTGCQQGEECLLHICFHGCQQGREYVGPTFVTINHLNNWAETNNIIVLYPQAVSTAIVNPQGCWDWWGYTGPDYATKYGDQIETVYSMMLELISAD